MGKTAHYGTFDDSEVLTLKAFADRICTNERTAERILERLGVPVQAPARGVNFVSCYQFRLAVEKGGFDRWERGEDDE
jgi:hypothetical protein